MCQLKCSTALLMVEFFIMSYGLGLRSLGGGYNLQYKARTQKITLNNFMAVCVCLGLFVRFIKDSLTRLV